MYLFPQLLHIDMIPFDAVLQFLPAHLQHAR